MFSQVGRHSSHFRIVSTIPLFTLLLSTNLVVVYLLKSQKASSILKVLKKYSKEKYSLSICSLFTLLLVLQLIALFSVYTTLRTTLAGSSRNCPVDSIYWQWSVYNMYVVYLLFMFVGLMFLCPKLNNCSSFFSGLCFICLSGVQCICLYICLYPFSIHICISGLCSLCPAVSPMFLNVTSVIKT